MSALGEAEKAVIGFTGGHLAFVGIAMLVIGILGSYWAWHHKIYQEGFDACQTQVDKVTAEAKADHDAQQAEIDRLAQVNQQETTAKLNNISGKLSKLLPEAAKPPVVFKQDCRMPADQVAAYNSIK